jgi:hypothetical protein
MAKINVKLVRIPDPERVIKYDTVRLKEWGLLLDQTAGGWVWMTRSLSKMRQSHHS